ncbi:MAG: NAD-dependent epimerase/dehydratase family protein [Anaerolineae bacterium]|nr:NAD-dependent epimerase/dehydratase family protein [Anaerolineae bacterium]MDQ7033273.1 NAD-dependent epimerase/dehydratase family protein [Anaerolineae bacterium]
MKNILIIGGTRNMGYFLTQRLLEIGHKVTILNRGMSEDDLPDTVYRLRADRTDTQQMRRALLGKSFDVVVDFVMHRGHDGQTLIDLLADKIEQYIFISSGQVYLTREGINRPFSEDDYEGRVMPPPKDNTYAYEEWRYGMNKRECEDVFKTAYEDRKFPYTSLRLPMVNSERDGFQRLYSYILRLGDGGSLLIPETPTYALRHIYGHDVVRVIEQLIDTGQGKGRVFNISQEETTSIDDFLRIVGKHMGVEVHLVRMKRSLLEANGFLPDCSPFSERWMSELDNTRSKEELGVTYTPLKDYLGKLVTHYTTHKPPLPVGYKRRKQEIQIAEQVME